MRHAFLKFSGWTSGMWASPQLQNKRAHMSAQLSQSNSSPHFLCQWYFWHVWGLSLSTRLTGSLSREDAFQQINTSQLKILLEQLLAWHLMIHTQEEKKNQKWNLQKARKHTFLICFYLLSSFLFFFFCCCKEKVRVLFMVWTLDVKNEQRAGMPGRSERCKTLPDGCRKLLQR